VPIPSSGPAACAPAPTATAPTVTAPTVTAPTVTAPTVTAPATAPATASAATPAYGCDAAATPGAGSPARDGRKDGRKSETALLGTLTIPGRPEFARAARRFVARTLRDGYPCADTAVLLTSELVGNSLQYSDSRLPGGVITVTLMAITGGIRAEVADRGGRTAPAICQPDPGGELAEGGRGLRLVELLSARWSCRREPARTITWFELASAAE
jgi:anti-sigma regulatory factor (Ser/Thr protein kinase)